MVTRPTRSNQILVCLSWAFAASALIPIIGFVGWFATTSLEAFALVLGVIFFAGFCVWTHIDALSSFSRRRQPVEEVIADLQAQKAALHLEQAQ